jgi:MSHA pilin protein MshC
MRLEGRSAWGFTLVEAVVVISVVGILAAMIAPRFMARDAFESRGYYDQAIASVRFAQQTAIAWRRPVFVCVSAAGYSVGAAAGCPAALVNPATGQSVAVSAPPGVTLAGPSFSFDSAGRPNPNAQITVALNSTIPGDPARTIVVEAETGYVHP